MIVSDSTTLIILLDLERMDLLTNLFEQIIIPQTVYTEITAKKPIPLTPFISVRNVEDTPLLDTLTSLLDQGESEAIALALELEMPLIIDEKKGRKIALNQGIRIIGLLGIVYLNIKKGYLSEEEAKTFLDDALTHGYRISCVLINTMFASLSQ